ncbi:MAG TPA: LPS export ABC transporter periplasmic protein LptC [Alphaproteobacteria bacterium]|jgi:lipopolysaccharide export system protein LptC|nr:LPS export ABC transporter periplasmic protein LptC [Alphaproteobacteria bacterium]
MAAGPLPGDDAPNLGEPPRRVAAVKRRRYVVLLRIALPMAALLLAALVVAWPKLQTRERSSFNLQPVSADPKEVEQLRMVNPRFLGLDAKQQPYTITALTATQERPGADTILLDTPQADIQLETGAWVTVTAQNGRYSQKGQTLDLQGDINVFHDLGYEFHTESAHVDLATSTVSGEEHVTGHGPSGNIDSQGFMILDRGATVVFSGSARLLLTPGAQGGLTSGGAPAGAKP